ncbi:hypothetical protein ACFV4I_21155 [Nocardiopsis alba]|uniref:hypothetical protein n=1 Tax=Nocardiopsis alba TaxID=53437 RepID=UPI00364DF58E
MKRHWSLTGVFVARHAGLPFDWLEGIGGDTSVTDAADAVLDAEQALLALPRAARPAVRSAVEASRPEQLGGGDHEWECAVAAWSSALEAYESAFVRADEAATRNLVAVLGEERVREAVLLSNPDAYRNMLLPFLRHEGRLTSRRRRERRQLYTYLQRFCAKNETTSFFGPMAYGSPVPGSGLTLSEEVPVRRRVFLSGWAARAVRRALVRDRGVLPALRFALTGRGAGTDEKERRIAGELVEGPLAIGPLARATGLTPRETASALRSMTARSSADVLLGGDPYDPAPLTTLREQVAGLPDTPSRAAWLERLERLETLRIELQDADLAGRERLIPDFERAFTEITGEPARRSAGRTYADRAIFFEECASPFAVRVGQETLDHWSRLMAPLLETCVAHGAATQDNATRALARVWRGPDRQPLSEYALAMAETFETTGSLFLADHAPRYAADRQEEEKERLTLLAGQQEGDRYAVVDVCLPAPSADRAASVRPLVARVHHHLQIDGWLATMHPDPEDFEREARTWIAEQDGRVVGFDFGRRNKGFYRFPGPRVALRDPAVGDREDELLLTAEDLSVHRTAEGVELWSRGRRVHAYLPLSDFVKYPPYAALSHPQVVHPVFEGREQDTVPRVGVGGADLQRARWSLPTGALTDNRPWARYLALRRLARRTGHRFLFCRTEAERKPYLIDTRAVPAADLIAHIASGAELITVEEMSPCPEELWLRDSLGRRYTCEFRMQAIGRAE